MPRGLAAIVRRYFDDIPSFNTRTPSNSFDIEIVAAGLPNNSAAMFRPHGQPFLALTQSTAARASRITPRVP